MYVVGIILGNVRKEFGTVVRGHPPHPLSGSGEDDSLTAAGCDIWLNWLSKTLLPPAVLFPRCLLLLPLVVPLVSPLPPWA